MEEEHTVSSSDDGKTKRRRVKKGMFVRLGKLEAGGSRSESDVDKTSNDEDDSYSDAKQIKNKTWKTDQTCSHTVRKLYCPSTNTEPLTPCCIAHMCSTEDDGLATGLIW